ncbi:MAG: JAB domain-containing protein [Pseudonocardiaceae bacterium]
MTAVDIWLPALGTIEERARLIGDGFGVEVALVWPVIGGSVGQEIIVGAGSRDRVGVRPDRVFQHAVRLGAEGIVFSHNHLKDTGPSVADSAVTRRLVAAGHLLGIPLLASLVVEPSATHDLVSDRTWRS